MLTAWLGPHAARHHVRLFTDPEPTEVPALAYASAQVNIRPPTPEMQALGVRTVRIAFSPSGADVTSQMAESISRYHAAIQTRRTEIEGVTLAMDCNATSTASTPEVSQWIRSAEYQLQVFKTQTIELGDLFDKDLDEAEWAEQLKRLRTLYQS